MARNVDLTSKEWRDLIFEGKNKEFGAYDIRKKSDRRHNLAVLYTVIGLILVGIGIWAWSLYSDYRNEQARLEALAKAEAMMQAQMQEAETPEEEPEQQKYEEEKKPEVKEEVAASVQQTEIKIVKKEEVKNEVITQDERQEDDRVSGVVTQEGSLDVDHHKVVEQQVVVTPEPPKEEKPKPKDDEIFVAVEQQAQFKGNVNKWLSSHTNYPQEAADNDIQGRVVVKFCVEKDGSISQVSVLKGVDRSLDREAVRVVKSMPKWQPAKNNGVTVRSWFTLPVTFRLADR